MRTIFRDRLIWFLLVGAAVFWVADQQQQIDDQVIRIDKPVVKRLISQWITQSTRTPSPQEVEALIAEYIREEVMFREAIALGFDQQDTIVRRRLVQKMDFFIQDNIAVSDAHDDQLTAYYQANSDKYLIPLKFSFEHVYYQADTEGATIARDLQRLQNNQVSADGVGTAFMWQSTYKNMTVTQIEAIFGDNFAQALVEISQEFPEHEAPRWVGPIDSHYGRHLIYLQRVEQPHLQPMADILDVIAVDWEQEQIAQEKAKQWHAIRNKYIVVEEFSIDSE